jgi:hypothetical protein
MGSELVATSEVGSTTMNVFEPVGGCGISIDTPVKLSAKDIVRVTVIAVPPVDDSEAGTGRMLKS